jgi:pimeloyl-ACP methyl ester carboxylesterase/DNA-binding CsgD family transcriptional regulator
MAQGGPVAIEYAVRHPEQISRLVFYGSYPGASAIDLPEDRELDEALNAVIEVGWERPTPEFRRVFTFLMIPGASPEQMGWLDDLQRRAVSGRIAVTARRQRGAADSTHLLPEITAPTLVIHSVGDRMNDFSFARLLASRIDGARLVGLESDNHILLEDEPAWPVFLRTVTEFLAADQEVPTPAEDPRSVLSARELEVLELAARGHDNAAIAAELVLSVRTVERHLQNIYDKLGLRGKSARTGAVGLLLAGG